MNSADKFLTLVFVFLLLTTSVFVLSVTPATVQAAPKPSVPQFSIKFIDNSYDVPASTTTIIDPYTGKESTATQRGYRVDNRSIAVTIKNQPFTPYTDENGNKNYLYYRVEVKGHFGEDWWAFGSAYIAQSSSEYTVVLQGVTYAAGSQLDFRVIAVICILGDAIRDTGSLAYHLWGVTSPYIESEVSRNLSGVQVFTMPGGSSTLPPSQTTTPSTQSITSDNNGDNQSQQEPLQLPIFMINPLFLLMVGFLFVGIVVALVLVFLRRHLKTFEFSNNFPQSNICTTCHVL